MIDKIKNDMKEAMKAGDKIKVSTLRMILSEIKNLQISKGSTNTELEEADLLSLLQKGLKKREEAAEAFRTGGREEMADKELAEGEIIRAYLPKGFTDDELEKIVEEAITEAGATSKREIGNVMKAVMSKYRGRVDGKKVKDLTASKLP